MILVLDNYDSFTYNLVQYLGELCRQGAASGAQIEVVRNDQADPAELAARGYEKIVISPGPGTPDDAGISCELIRRADPTTPVLGVCLGHQCIGQVYGGRVGRAPTVLHGKTSLIHHKGGGVFKGLPDPFEATRYHSLILERDSAPACLDVTAWTDDGVIMGVKHLELPVYGVQFHPESFLTSEGKALLRNFLNL